jgi:hypothetical protein
MAMEKKSLSGAGADKRQANRKSSKGPAGDTTAPAKPADVRKLAVARLATAKLSTAKLVTLKKIGG